MAIFRGRLRPVGGLCGCQSRASLANNRQANLFDTRIAGLKNGETEDTHFDQIVDPGYAFLMMNDKSRQGTVAVVNREF